MNKFIAICLGMSSLLLFSIMPASGQEVQLLDAVHKTLRDNPGVLIQKETVMEREGNFQTSSGAFDWHFFTTLQGQQLIQPVTEADQKSVRDQRDSQNAQIQFLNTLPGANFTTQNTLIPSDNEEKIYDIQVGMNKQFRTGIIFTPSVSVTDYKNDTSVTPAARSNVALKLVIPLMKGLGRDIAGAEELAAESRYKAEERFSCHRISESVYMTIINFWNCLAAKQSFDLVQESFNRSEDLFNNVSGMVTAGLLEPAFLNQAQAKLYSTKADVSDGKVSYFKSRQTLGLAMGNSGDDLENPPFPQGVFPPVMKSEDLIRTSPEDYIKQAKTNRQDYHASLAAIDTEEALLQKAVNNKKPKLDLTVQMGYAGLSEDSNTARFFHSTGDRVSGLNGFAGISLDLPITNNAAKGQILSQKASLRIAKLNSATNLNNITSEVLSALESIKGLISQYELANQSAERYKDAVVFEKKKYDAGESTLNALIDIEDRYIKARLLIIEIVRKYAVALTNLRFVTGSLLEKKQEQLHFNPETLTGPLS